VTGGTVVTWAVFLDRDGVLTDAPVVDGKALAPTEATDLTVLPRVPEAIEMLRAAGAMLFVVTNQPDVARGTLDPRQLDLMHEHLRAALGVEQIRVCPHDGIEGCACRKPKAGMLLDLVEEFAVDPSASWMVGDRWVDVAAGAAAGVTTVLVDRPYSWRATSAGSPAPDLQPDHRVDDLYAAATLIVRTSAER
jgi:D-glycero-D-manno-heptose 1,7-bisphosphate phosphatase